MSKADEQLRDNFGRAMDEFYKRAEAWLKEIGQYEDFKKWQAKYGLSQRLNQTVSDTEHARTLHPKQTNDGGN